MRTLLQIRDRILLPDPNLIEFSVTNERIGDVSKGSQHETWHLVLRVIAD
jgi:hypothetical protein